MHLKNNLKKDFYPNLYNQKLKRKPVKNTLQTKIISRNVKRKAYLKNKEDLNNIYRRREKLIEKDKINPIDEISRQDLINHKRELQKRNKKTLESVNYNYYFKERQRIDSEKVTKAKDIINKKSYANLDDWKVNPKKIDSKTIKKTKEGLQNKKSHKFATSALEKTLKKNSKKTDRNNFYRDKGYLYKTKVLRREKLGSKEIAKKRLMRKMQLNALTRTKNMKIIAMEAARRGTLTPAQARYALLQSGSIKSLIKKIDETSIISSKLKKEKKEILIHRNKRDNYHRYAKNLGKINLKNEKDIKAFYGKIKNEQRKYFNTAFQADNKNRLIARERKKKLRKRINRQIAYAKGLERKGHIDRLKKVSKNQRKIYLKLLTKIDITKN
ncbi:hypothetical protein [Peptoniphilus timonensis]|uniref:hypothetical protein n=1 Tax=Peptoniphilus timonensis TaxID=1268254 RepID=UPI0002DA8199|nr:hypothetical protein [Peptoniphilus timonensis]